MKTSQFQLTEGDLDTSHFMGSVTLILTLSACPTFAEEVEMTAGEKVFVGRCSECHDVGAPEPLAEGEKAKMGPPLQGLFGRMAGTWPDFAYSDAMLNAGFIWDEAMLTAYLANPKAVVPKNRMPFNGLKRPGEMEEIIAYLKEATR